MHYRYYRHVPLLLGKYHAVLTSKKALFKTQRRLIFSQMKVCKSKNRLALNVTIYYVNNTTYINKQLLNLKSWKYVSSTVSHHQAKNETYFWYIQ